MAGRGVRCSLAMVNAPPVATVPLVPLREPELPAEPFSRLRRGPTAIYVPPTGDVVTAEDRAGQVARCRAFIDALGGDGAAAVVFDDGDAVLTERTQSAFWGEILDFDSPQLSRLQAWDAPVYPVLVIDDAAPYHKQRHAEVVLRRLRDRGTTMLARFDPTILAPDAAAVEALEAGDAGAWAPLIEALRRGQLHDAAPAAFLEALLARAPEVATWVERMGAAIDALGGSERRVRDDQAQLGRGLAHWMNAGILRALPAGDPRRLQAVLGTFVRKPPPDVVEQARALCEEVRRVFPGSPLLLRALALYGARCLEEGLWDDALLAAREAEQVEQHLEERDVDCRTLPRAARLRSAAHLGRLEIIEAFTKLGPLLILFRMLGGTAGLGAESKRFVHSLEPLEEAKRGVALHAQYTDGTDRAWLDAAESLARAVAATRPEVAEQLRVRVHALAE